MDNLDKPEAIRQDHTPSILMPLPDRDFDPTEAAIPWQVLHRRGWNVTISTEHGAVAAAHPKRVKGPLPGLLSPNKKVRDAYQEMTSQPAFKHPIPYEDINPSQFDALLLPGGDGPGMRQYLESEVLRIKVLEFWQQGKPIGAICHGILVAARTVDPRTGRSILYGRKVTALPKLLDNAAFKMDSWLTKQGYIMYPKCVEDEVRDCLAEGRDFSAGGNPLSPHVITDGNLVTARWYGEAEEFAVRFANELEGELRVGSSP